MLLTITTTYFPATDIGFLLHKNPQNLHTIPMSFGQAYVFYPEATEDRCTVALLLDVDPIALVRKNKPSSGNFTLEPYVNDRPYVASSFMSVALSKVFGTLFSGKSKHRQELVDKVIPLEVKISVLHCQGGQRLLHSLFEPLGYEVESIQHALDSSFPEWGNSSYFTVILKRTCILREFLIHLYVLIPVLDNEKHYWVDKEEIEKLLRLGEGWLSSHPEKDLISDRYLNHYKPFVNEALDRLFEEKPEVSIDITNKEIQVQEEVLESKINLNQIRLDWVANELRTRNIKRIVDLGCGEGKLIQKLFQDNFFEKIVGCDVASRSLEVAKNRLKLDRLSPIQLKRIEIMQTSLTYRDKRLLGYDAATLVEVIEHLDLSRLESFKRVVFEFMKPKLVLITTPNSEYNVIFENLPKGKFRHKDHRFEWTRNEFQNWANQTAQQFNYSVIYDGIGNKHDTFGAVTQVGVFIKNDE